MQARCPQCRESVQVGEKQSLDALVCATCGHDFSLLGEETLPPVEPIDRHIGHFRLERQLGAGAFGSVWLARDSELDRPVALKMPRKGKLSPHEADQFLREARAAAQLRHPNIVAVHEVGRENDQIYIVSDYVPGQSLGEWLRGRRLTPTRAAELAATIADALGHAHAAGVIHRDLKPGNILLDDGGEPHIADFGLARRERVDVTMTADGAPLGTPAYMSPEQARGDAHRADRRSDIYSLGVILYELLTGELPFRGNLRMMLHQVLHEEPAPPRRLDPSVPRDLETICLKCMEKEPAARFDTAGEVATELRRFLAGEPIHARPVGRAERTWRWAKRKPALATASGVALAGLLGVAIVSALLAVAEARNASAVAGEQARTAEALVASQLLAAELAMDKGQLLGEQGDVNLALLWMARALELVPPEAADLERAIRLSVGAWSRQAVQLRSAMDAPGLPCELAYSDDGRRLLIASSDGTRLHVQVLDTDNLQALQQFTHDAELTSQAMANRDLSRLLVGYTSGACRLFDVETGEVLWELTKPGHVTINQFSPDERLALLAWNDDATRGDSSSTIQLHDAATGEPVGPVRAHDMPSSAAAFTPDGRSFAVASGMWADDRQRGSLRMWTLEGEDWVFGVSTPSMTTHMKFAPGGERFLTGHADFKVREWNLGRGGTTSAPVPEVISSQQGPVWRVFYHPLDPGRIVAGGFDGTVRIWDLSTGDQIGPPLRHDMLIREMALRRDGSGFATGALDHSVRLWRAIVVTPDERPGIPLAIGPDRLVVLQSDEQNNVSLRNLSDGEPLGVSLPHEKNLLLHQGSVSDDARLAATLDVDMQVRLWNVETGRLVIAPAGAALHVAISPDGRRLATANWNAAGIWDATTGRKLLHLPLSTQSGPVLRVDFSPDGRFLAGGGTDSAAHLWNATTGEEVATFPHATTAASVTFSADGRYVAVGGNDGTRIWDVQTHEPVGGLLQHDALVLATAFSPDGRLLLSGGNEGHVRLWDVASGKPVGPPLPGFEPQGGVEQLRGIGTVGFLPDGTKAYAGPGELMAMTRQTVPVITRFWDVPAPVTGEPEDIRIWVESITGMTLDERGGVSVLNTKQWETRRSQRRVPPAKQQGEADTAS